MTSTDGGGEGPRTTAELLASIAVNVPALIAKEVELLGLEVRRITTDKLTALGLLVVAALAGLLVLGLGAVTVARALEAVFASPWVAWAIVTAVVAVLTLGLLAAAARLLQRPWTPVRTAASLRDTAAWARDLGATALGGPATAAPPTTDPSTAGGTPEGPRA
jgi:hypothetical protein